MIDITSPQSLLDTLAKLTPSTTIEELRELVADDCVLSEPESLPYGGIYKGPEGVREAIGHVYSTWTEFTSDIQKIWTDNVDSMIILTLVSGRTSKGSFSNMPLAESYTIKDGKIAEVLLIYSDTKRLAELTS